jgi:hypothetical protein
MAKQPKIYGPCSVKQQRFLNADCTLVIYGGGAGSGKTHLAQVLALKYKDDPQFRAVYIRQSSTQLSQAGGLWDSAQDMYDDFGARFNQTKMIVKFPSGAEISHKTCGHDRDLKNFDGKYTCRPSQE